MWRPHVDGRSQEVNRLKTIHELQHDWRTKAKEIKKWLLTWVIRHWLVMSTIKVSAHGLAHSVLFLKRRYLHCMQKHAGKRGGRSELSIYIHHAGTVNAGKDFTFSVKWMRLHQACTISVWKSVLINSLIYIYFLECGWVILGMLHYGCKSSVMFTCSKCLLSLKYMNNHNN